VEKQIQTQKRRELLSSSHGVKWRATPQDFTLTSEVCKSCGMEEVAWSMNCGD
jgi:hypothetical protein